MAGRRVRRGRRLATGGDPRRRRMGPAHHDQLRRAHRAVASRPAVRTARRGRPAGCHGRFATRQRGPPRPSAAPRARHGRRRRGVRRPARRVPARPARRSRGDARRGSRGSRVDRPTFDRRRRARGRARRRSRRGAGPPRGATAGRRPPGDRALAGALRVDPFGPVAEQLDPRADGALVLGRRPSSRRLADRAHGGRVHRWPPRLVLLRRGSRGAPRAGGRVRSPRCAGAAVVVCAALTRRDDDLPDAGALRRHAGIAVVGVRGRRGALRRHRRRAHRSGAHDRRRLRDRLRRRLVRRPRRDPPRDA